MKPTTISNVNREIIGKTYQMMKQSCFAIFRQACIPEEICEDLVQEVFMKLMTLDILLESQIKGLAIQIAYQKRTDYLRHRAIVNKVKNDTHWRIEQSYTNTDAEVNDILQVELKVINSMSENDSRIYKLTRFENKSADEIVLETGLSKRAVESRIYRTRIMVRNSVKMAMGF